MRYNVRVMPVLITPVLVMPVLIMSALIVPALVMPAGVAAATSRQHTEVATAAAGTGKERLSDKSSDEQRLNDCKVPEARRTKARPVKCSAGSDDTP